MFVPELPPYTTNQDIGNTQPRQTLGMINSPCMTGSPGRFPDNPIPSGHPSSPQRRPLDEVTAPLGLTDIPWHFVSSGSDDLMLPGRFLVVLGACFEAAVQDADEPIRELPQGGVVTDFPGTERVVVGPRAG